MAELNEKKAAEPKAAPEKKKKEKKPGLFKKMGKFFRECKSELKKVTWLSRKETVKSSIVVVCVTLALCIVIGALDTILEFGVMGLRDLSSLLGWR